MGTCDVVSSCMCGGVRALAGIHPEPSYLAELRDKTFVYVCVFVISLVFPGPRTLPGLFNSALSNWASRCSDRQQRKTVMFVLHFVLFLKIISLHTSYITFVPVLLREVCLFISVCFCWTWANTRMTNQMGSMIVRKYFNLVLCLFGCNHNQTSVLTSLRLVNTQTLLIHPVTI